MTRSQSRRYRTAIIGDTNRGGYGHHLATAAAGMPELDIVALSDPDANGRAAAQAVTGAAHAYAGYREMLDAEAPEIVVICPRWVDQRVDHVLAATDAGAHIFIEKPLAATVHDADAIAAACVHRDRRIAIAYQSRAHPACHHVRNLLREAAIGRLRLARGLGKMDHRGGMQDLHILGAHVIDLMRFLVGEPEWVSGELYQDGRLAGPHDLHECADALGRLPGNALRLTIGLPGGVIGSFESHANLGKGEDLFGIDFAGEAGQLSIRGGLTKRVLTYPQPYVVPGAGFDTWQPVDIPTAEPGDVPGPMGMPDRELFERANQRLLRDLIGAIEEDRPPVSCGIDAVRTVEVIQAGLLSHGGRGPVALPLADRHGPVL